MIQLKQNTNRICYMILPEGIKENLAEGLAILSEKYSVSIVVINDVDWNNDLTPWPADGVFKKAKPFGGHAAGFLDKLTHEIIPDAEKQLGIEEAERTILGVSLSGLFAVWQDNLRRLFRTSMLNLGSVILAPFVPNDVLTPFLLRLI